MPDLIGRMDKVVKFYKNTGTSLAGGGGKDDYTLTVTTRGYLKKSGGGSRSGAFAEILSNDSYELIVRRQVAIRDLMQATTTNEGIATKIEIPENSDQGVTPRRFTIQSWENVGEDYFYYKFNLTEQRA